MAAAPILDLDQDPPSPSRPRFSRPLVLALGVLLGVALSAYADGSLPHLGGPGINVWLMLPCLYLAIAVHETGHLIAGRLAGLGNGGISIGAFVFTRTERGWVFQFDPHRWLGGYFRPLATVPDAPRSRYVWLVAGGPLASAVFTGATVFLWVRTGDGAGNWTGTLVWMSLFITVTSIIPYASGLEKSDGSRLYHLLRDPDHARTWTALIELGTEDLSGVRPKDWSAKTFARILAVDPAAPEYPQCRLLAYYRASDCGRPEEQVQHIEDALAGSAEAGRLLRHALFLEAAWTSARIRNEPAHARAWLDRATRLRKPELRAVVEAVIEMSEGRYQESLRHWEEANAYVIRRGLDSGTMRAARERWVECQTICRAALNR